MKKLKTDKTYYVEWLDAGDVMLHAGTGEKVMWIDKTTLTKYFTPKNCASVGLLVVDKKDYILLAGSFDLEQSETSNIQIIPKGCIVHIERLYIKSYFKKEGK